MAINSLDMSCDSRHPKSQSILCNYSQSHALPTTRIVNIGFATESSTSSSISKQGKFKKNFDFNSPYLTGDNIHILSRVTGKKLTKKKGINGIPSLPIVANLYKASSDQLKTTKNKKTVKKSVLTLPTEHAPAPQTCTTSDMNDSEYCNKDNDNRKKGKKRNTTVNKKLRRRGRNFEFYDRDAQYCSQMNIDLDCSSTDLIKNFNGDAKLKSKSVIRPNRHFKEKVNPHDVWTILRNINRFQFTPSPPLSEDSFIKTKKKNGPKRRSNRKDISVVETCHTEEFAYISSYELNNKSPRSFSPDSSFDRVTVIDTNDDFAKVPQDLEGDIVKTTKLVKGNNNKAKHIFHRSYNKSGKTIKTKCLTNKSKDEKNMCDDLSGDSSLTVPYKNIKCENQPTDLVIEKNNKCNQDHSHNTIPENSNGSFPYSVNSSSSKALNVDNETNNTEKVSDKTTSTKSRISQNPNYKKMVSLNKNISAVQLNKLHDSHIQPQKISMRMPILTKIDIRRWLSKQKFPIVILGKEEFTDVGYEVIKGDPPQFDGLDKHIWPYMVDWYQSENKTSDNSMKMQTKSTAQNKVKKDMVKITSHNNNNKLTPSKQFKTNDKKPVDIKSNNKAKIEHKRNPLTGIANEVKEHEKYKSIQKLKERMVKLLYTNSVQNVSDHSTQIGHTDIIEDNNYSTSSKSVGTCNESEFDTKNTQSKVLNPIQTKPVADEKRSMTKGKWTSEFIESVIRKIKNGVYYTNEGKFSSHQKDHDYNDAEIQTILPCSNVEKAMQSNCDSDIIIPGFDDLVPELEITTMNTSEITVKHCMTNIIVHFDVTMPMIPGLKMKQSSTSVPPTMTESHTKIYKCKTSILNTMLPAQLCTILPNMIHNLIEFGEQIFKSPSPTLLPELSTISEVTVNESREAFPVPASLKSLEIIRLLCGSYMKSDKIFPKLRILGKTALIVKYDSQLVDELIPHLSKHQIFDCQVNLIEWTPLLANEKGSMKTASAGSKQINACTAVVPYTAPEQMLLAIKNSVDPSLRAGKICHFVNSGQKSVNVLLNNIISINLTIPDMCNAKDNIIRMSSGNFITDISFEKRVNEVKSIEKCTLSTNKPVVASSKQAKYLDIASININKKPKNYDFMTNNNNSEMGFKANQGKKCRTLHFLEEAPPNKPEEMTTSLNKITNIDEFFQALGAANSLASVFENSVSGKKLMSCITEMKNWTTEINPNQALLLLLLTNKRDTPKLVRCRTVLLHSIAANRITKAHELDLEIEVIEKEQLNILNKYDGISYLPGSIENQDSLYEELCWIAKNTASDYQRPFDESSEKLLKSLLEKRKKLNPSYLRVMARYVGLGLLKSPGKE